MTQRGETGPAEGFGEREFFGFINGGANHELKLLTGAILLSNPEVPYSNSALSQELIGRQGEAVVWKVSSGTPAQYCNRSLEPIGAVVKTEVIGKKGKPVIGYQAEPLHREAKLACTGALLGWSLDYPDLSLQQSFGATQSSSMVRTPEIRYRVYTALLANRGGLTISDIFTSLKGEGYPNYESMNTQLTRMQELGLVALRTTYGEDHAVIIEHTSYDALFGTLEDAMAETQAAYAAIRQVGQGETTSVNEIISKALEVDPAINATLLRSKLLSGLHFGGYPGLAVVGEPQTQRSAVTLAPKAKKPIRDLHKRLEAVRDGDYSGIETATDIIGDTESFRTLVAKAKRFSPLVMGKALGHQLLESQLISIVSAPGGVTVRQARNALITQYGRDIAGHTVRAALAAMVRHGKIASDTIAKSPHSKKKTMVFKSNEQ